MKQKELDEIRAILTEAEAGEKKYAVVLRGGSIGSRNISSVSDLRGQPIIDKKAFDTYAEAMEDKKYRNKRLSPGEKKYYGLLYIIAGIVDGKYTGKGK